MPSAKLSVLSLCISKHENIVNSGEIVSLSCATVDNDNSAWDVDSRFFLYIFLESFFALLYDKCKHQQRTKAVIQDEFGPKWAGIDDNICTTMAIFK